MYHTTMSGKRNKTKLLHLHMMKMAAILQNSWCTLLLENTSKKVKYKTSNKCFYSGMQRNMELKIWVCLCLELQSTAD